MHQSTRELWLLRDDRRRYSLGLNVVCSLRTFLFDLERYFGTRAHFIGIVVFVVGWVDRTHTGFGVFTLPILFPLAGIVLVVGARRWRIRIATEQKTYQWTAPPLFQNNEELRGLLSDLPNLEIEEDD